MKIPITKPVFDECEIELVRQCLDTGWVTQGPFVNRLEGLFAERHLVSSALATTSCTAALHLAAIALGLKAGDEVIVPAFTWITSAHCAEYVGAKAVFADIDLATFNLDPQAFEAAITPQTKAVVVVHLFGLAAEIEPILVIAHKHGLKVIEDAACAVGTEYDGQPVGSFGDVGCFSLHPRKAITTGEGGMMTVEDPAIAEKLASLRNHGAVALSTDDPDFGKPWCMNEFNDLGYNLRMSDIQAAVGVAQMDKLDILLTERYAVAERYTSLFSEVDEIITPTSPEKCDHTYQSYVIRLHSGSREKRNAIMLALAERSIQTRPGTHAVHRLGYYRRKYNLEADQFPNACLAEDSTITIPLYQGMTEDDQNFVCNEVKEALFKL